MVGTPIEGYANGTKVSVEITYDREDRVVKAVPIRGQEVMSAGGVKTALAPRTYSWPLTRNDPGMDRQEVGGGGDGGGEAVAAVRLDVGDAGLGQQREGDDGDLPEVDLEQTADAGAGVTAALHGAEADRETIERTGAHQGEDFAGARHLGHQAAAGVEAARVFLEGRPHADRLGGVVLEQHLDAGGAAFGESSRGRRRAR